ncbi:hypothetical protein BDK51DRAFT_31284 [Blyttiomyces helicus]|uniref:Argonaute linker 1 domain-containing protein n=1 Tax=Blyttiomyces helicus TaxID=388810 RepID=A0A4P9VY58_9FUNG|nr:hypothetical protein BDK51DRAFT_31284 [Blyttiomyces helicus]|eukprot:RKO83875.1 hypothetical protein BDK51DRAFT_31284 [Blyttiomyces helicus]
MASNETRLARRPDDGGHHGQSVELETNFYSMKVLRWPLYEYEVLFDPEGTRAIRNTVFQFFVKNAPKNLFSGGTPAFDGSRTMITSKLFRKWHGRVLEMGQACFYAVDYLDGVDAEGRKKIWVGNAIGTIDRYPLPTGTDIPVTKHTAHLTFTTFLSTKPFVITIRRTNTFNLDDITRFFQGDDVGFSQTPYAALAALRIVAAQRPAEIFVAARQGFYGNDGSECIGGGGMAWRGLKLSVCAGTQTPFLNLDMTTTAFVQSGPCVDVASRILTEGKDGTQTADPPDPSRIRWSLRDREKILQAWRGVRILVTHRGERKVGGALDWM